MITPSLRALHNLAARTLVAESGGRLSLDEAMRTNSDLWAIARTIAVMAQQVAWHAVLGWRDLFLDTARGAALDRLVLDRYGLYRLGASPGRGSAVVWFDEAQSEDVEVTTSALARSTTGLVFRPRYSMTIPAGSTALYPLELESVVAGSGQGADWGEIVGWETRPSARLRISNAQELEAAGASRIAGSADAETDDQFRSRVRGFWRAAARGIGPAIEFGARTVAGVKRATVVEVLQDDGLPGGVFWVYIADEEGMSSPALVAEVQAVIDLSWAAFGVVPRVVGGSPRSVPIIVSPRLRYGHDIVRARRNTVEALVALGSRQFPGEKLLYADILAALRRVPQLVVDDATLVAPIGDVEPTERNDVLRILPADVSFQARA